MRGGGLGVGVLSRGHVPTGLNSSLARSPSDLTKKSSPTGAEEVDADSIVELTEPDNGPVLANDGSDMVALLTPDGEVGVTTDGPADLSDGNGDDDGDDDEDDGDDGEDDDGMDDEEEPRDTADCPEEEGERERTTVRNS